MNGYGMNMGFYQECRQTCELSMEQKLGLKQLILLEQTLKEPEFPNARVGLEGLRIANFMLSESQSAGILIGGLSESVWNQRRKVEELSKHKDVDVMVLNYNFEAKYFEGGIDWWLPNKDRIQVYRKGDVTVSEQDAEWWENANGVILSFGAKPSRELNPGLYIPSSDWVIEMRVAETIGNIDYERLDAQIGDEVLDKFREKIKKRVKTRLPGFISEEFKGRILSELYGYNGVVDIFENDLATTTGIKNL